ncbi:MAG: tetratricopeptide repeat protein [Planctomycetaceae bacterium]|nr:tetratricopeptide repeat protein [Planctomycetaceae bacterium]
MSDNNKIAADCWRRGNEAVPKENWDYAIQMYGTSVKLVPDNLMYRQSLRYTEYKKYGGNLTGAKMAGMKLMGVKTMIKKAKMGKNWKALDQAAEVGLQVNPWDPQLNADMAEACAQLGYPDAAIFGYKESLKADPTNKEVNKALARILEERGEYKTAIECWQRILKIEPTSGEARSKITQLDARTVMDRGGYEGAESTRNVRVGGPSGPSRPGQPADGPGMSAEADLLRAIRKEPTNKDNYLKLADYYRRESQLEQAEEQLLKALEVSSGDLAIRELLEDVQLALMTRTHTGTKEQLRQKPDDAELRQRAVDLGNELLKREMEVLATRVERYPQDMKIKFELASRYMRVKKWALAIPLFQKSRGDPRVDGESLISLGKCFFYDGKASLAIRQFESAFPKVKFEEKPDLFKDMYYSAGRLYEEMKNFSAAEECYQKVLEVDYDFRDTVKRLDALQGGAVEKPAEEE